MTSKPCAFCTLPLTRIVNQNEHAVWIRDGFPVSPGHSLVIPKRHVGSFFETSDAERQSLLALIDQAKAAAWALQNPNEANERRMSQTRSTTSRVYPRWIAVGTNQARTSSIPVGVFIERRVSSASASEQPVIVDTICITCSWKTTTP